jgi:predicted dehydrogenase
MSKNSLNRREFLSSAALVGAASGLGAGALLSSCAGSSAEPTLVPLRPESEWNIPKLYEGGILPNKADDGRELKVGLIGCGGQGTGMLRSLLVAADGIKVVSLGDTFADRIEGCRTMLRRQFSLEIPDEMCFVGFGNHQKVIDSGVDMVIIVTPPAFRPMQFRAAVEAGKHAFMEKPLCVDPVGARSILNSARQATGQGLCVVTGTQRHHQRVYIEGYKQVQSGLIGEIVGGNVYWNQHQLWHRSKEPQWTDMEWMIRDWVNWNWLSGDHIVEQHIHNIDVFNWFSHLKPVSAVGFGARHRRVTGDQFDMFSIDFVYENGVHLHSMCRQIPGTATNVSERIQGTKGVWTSNGVIVDLKGEELWRYDYEAEKEEFEQNSPSVLQMVNWVNHIRKGVIINQAEECATSSLTAIMGRESAYRGSRLEWDSFFNSDMNLVPAELDMKNMDWRTLYPVPVPGSAG